MNLRHLKADQAKALVLESAPTQGPWVFDCDGTLIKGDIASMTAWALIRFGFAHAELMPKEFEEFKTLPFDYAAFRRLRKLIVETKGINSIYEWEAFLHAGLPPKTSYDVAKLATEEGFKIGSMSLTGAVSDLARKNKEIKKINPLE